MVLQALENKVAQTVTGLGYDLVEVSRLGGGLLRVTIDTVWEGHAASSGSSSGSNSMQRSITVEDCERVTRQLQYLFEVENVDYQRLEVSSPGLDRRLRQPRDLYRFEGCVVDVALRPIEGAAPGTRRKFRGALHRHHAQAALDAAATAETATAETMGQAAPTSVVLHTDGMQEGERDTEALWEVQWQESQQEADMGHRPGAKPHRVSKGRKKDFSGNAPAQRVVQRVVFSWRDVLEARLAPVVDFRPRAPALGEQRDTAP